MATRLIGLMGRKRAGKDTFAARLIDAHGYKRFAFAANVYQAALCLDPYVGWSDAGGFRLRLSDVVCDIGWERAKDEYAEVRRVLQNFGTESIRRLDPDFWVRTVMADIDAHSGPAVITDVRFPNELEAVLSRGGAPIRVIRAGQPAAPDTHISETALDDHVPYLSYYNAGTVADLHTMADQAAYYVTQ